MRKLFLGLMLAVTFYLIGFGPICADTTMQKFNKYVKIWKAEAIGWMVPGKMDKRAIYNRFGKPDVTSRNIGNSLDYMEYNPLDESLTAKGYAMSFAFNMNSGRLEMANMVYGENVRVGKRNLTARDVVPPAFLNGSVIPGWQVMEVAQKHEEIYAPAQEQRARWLGPEEYWPYRQTVLYRSSVPKEMVGNYGRYNRVEVTVGFYLPVSCKKKIFDTKTLTYSDQVDYSGWKDRAQVRYMMVSITDRM